MQTITALTPQKQNKQRVSLFLDGEFAFGLPTAVAQALKIGQILTPPEIEALQFADQVDKAKQNALRLLSFRPRSVAEVKRNLQQKGYEGAIIQQALEQLVNEAWLDDTKFTSFWIEQRETFKPRSPLALRQELQQKGIDTETINELLEQIDEIDAARRAAQKKARSLHQLPQEQFMLKLGQFLQRRGFQYETIRQITQEIWQDLANNTKADG